LYGRGSAFFRSEDYESALKDLNALIKLDGKHSKAYHARGLLRGAEEKYKEAIKDLEKANSLAPGNQEVWLDLGGAFLLNKDFPNAQIAFEKAIELDKGCPEGWYGKAVVALFKKEHKKAIEFLNVALKFDPKHLNAILARAEAYLESGQRDDGIKDVKKAVALKPDIFGFENQKDEADYKDRIDDNDELSDDSELEDLKMID